MAQNALNAKRQRVCCLRNISKVYIFDSFYGSILFCMGVRVSEANNVAGFDKSVLLVKTNATHTN
jgi:hypothetical protein